MAMKMNKMVFIEKLKNRTNYNEEQCILINDILEDNFFIGKNNKDKIVNELKDKLVIDYKEAENIYEVSMDILTTELKYKMTHPFKSKD